MKTSVAAGPATFVYALLLKIIDRRIMRKFSDIGGGATV